MAEYASSGEHQVPPMSMSQKGQGDWYETRWYRILQPDGSLWMETSDHTEAAIASERTGLPVQRLWKREEWEWRQVE